MATDDHSRAGFVQMHPEERMDSAVQFLKINLLQLNI